MKYIVISDIHGNLEAIEAVVDTFSDDKSSTIICAGDVVGYGANPNECIKIVRDISSVNVLGNHEAAVTGKADIGFFNEYAAEAVRWTIDNTAPEGIGYINSLSYTYSDGDISLSHGTLHLPEEFIYMVSAAAAMHTFEVLKTKVCFVGHSHIPGVFVLRKGSVFGVPPGRVRLDKDARYIINAGSVGQPRDNDNRACYCVYDTEKELVEFRRVEYDVKKARKRIIDAGLPEVLGDRLLYGR